MPSVCAYFQVHQPYRLRRYSVFDTAPEYTDEPLNRRILSKVADKCYRPATEVLLRLVERLAPRFRVAFSLTGLVVEQFREVCPDVIDRFRALADTGCVEFLAETYYHSLAFLYSRDEFLAQIDAHAALMQETFGVTPTVFRNTELIYNNELADYLATLGRYKGVLAEGTDRVLNGRSPNHVYAAPGEGGLALLLKNYRLSDDVAFRFSNRSWQHWPVTAEKYAAWINRIDAEGGNLCNLFMDFETFGEHQWADTGILAFLEALPERVLESKSNSFRTPSEVIDMGRPYGIYDAPQMTSWADTERDLSAWLGNAMQSNALQELFKLEAAVAESDDRAIRDDWRRLTTSDHFYYMCTKYYADGQVHGYFNHYESPYDGYINFMNVLENLRGRVAAVAGRRDAAPRTAS